MISKNFFYLFWRNNKQVRKLTVIDSITIRNEATLEKILLRYLKPRSPTFINSIYRQSAEYYLMDDV